jgi:hypothetical protein
MKNEIICIPEKDETKRFILGVKGSKNLLAIALNPSTANEEKLDQTTKNVQTIAHKNGCDGWYVVNLSAARTPKPELLPSIEDDEWQAENLKQIEELLKFENIDKVLLGWGNGVNAKDYLKTSALAILKLIKKTNKPCYALKLTQAMQPYHPGPQSVNGFLGGIDKVTLNKMEIDLFILQLSVNGG